MCGIYITNIPYKEKEVLDKLNSIRFRGPDHIGIFEVEGITLGHLRLSILDLDPRAHQPMINGGYHLVYNGEIYNFKALRSELEALGHQFTTEGDTEVLLLGYKVWKEKLLSKLNGMFAFSIYDLNERKVFSARDRLGQKPFYYYWKDGTFEICSQLRPLVGDRKINKAAISMYLECRYIPSPHSIIENIYKLPPGSYMEIDLDTHELEINEYWNLKKIKTDYISYEDAKEHLHDLLKDAVKIRLQSDVPIGAFLSGGVDSALISSIANSVSTSQLNSYCIGFQNPKYDESAMAASYAKIIGSNHLETICESEQIRDLIPKLISVFDEPFADSSALPSLLLNRVVSEHVTVALSGDGGDESFLGYNHFDLLVKFNKILWIPFAIRKLIANSFLVKILGKPTESLRNALRSRDISEIFNYIYIGFKSLLIKRDLGWLLYYDRYKNLSKHFLQRAADFHIKLWLENDSNTKVDRASMAYSVEVRSPFMDYRIVEFARALPISYRFTKRRKKKILRDILNEYIPEAVFDQPKSGFSIPLGEWLRTDLKEEFQKTISEDFLYRVPNLDVSKFKHQFTEHMQGRADHATNIWKLYILAKWYKEFGFS
ncbi:MAG: asparagine synthase (glutamine-hydrolyzing) [Maribacter sp.]|nr:asparagine synthase (glutamine-hydrolyzing) [Maribacter sp.]